VRVAAPVELQQRPVDDPDVELPTAWRDGLVRIPPRAVPKQVVQTRYHSPNTAYALEMFGFVGYLGLGHMYAGRRGRGVLLMTGWWVVLAIFIPPFIRNFNLMSFMVFVLILSVGPILSGYWIRKDLKQEIDRRRWY